VSLTEIQEAIANLTSTEREELLRWLEQYKDDDWDRQINADAASGKLNFLSEEASQAKKSDRLRGVFKFRTWEDLEKWEQSRSSLPLR
jgi:hypothetical protein